MKEILHDIWMAETQQEAHKSFGQFETRYGAKYLKAAKYLTKYKVEILAFYDFPAEHWTHIRTTNPIESMFSTVRIKNEQNQELWTPKNDTGNGLQTDENCCGYLA